MDKLHLWINNNRVKAFFTLLACIAAVISTVSNVKQILEPSSGDNPTFKKNEKSRQVEVDVSQRRTEIRQTPPYNQPNLKNSDRLVLPKPELSMILPVKPSQPPSNLLSQPEPDEVTRLLERLGDTTGQDRGKRLLNYLQEMPIVHPLTPEQILQILGNISGDSFYRRDALILIMQNNTNRPLSGQDVIHLLDGFIDTNRAYALQDMRCYIKKPLSEAEKQSLLAGVSLSWRSDTERMLDNPINASCK